MSGIKQSIKLWLFKECRLKAFELFNSKYVLQKIPLEKMML